MTLRSRWLMGTAVALLVLTAGLLAAGLRPSASPALLVDPGSPVGRETKKEIAAFGDEPIVVSIRGDLATNTLVGANLLHLVNLEGRAARLPGVRAVYGPGTFLNTSLVQMQRLLQQEIGPVAKSGGDAARAAEARAAQAGASPAAAAAAGERARMASLGPRKQQYLDLMLRLGSTGIPSLTNRNFVMSVVFGAGITPKRRFAWLFPDASHALVLVRPQPGLEGQRLRALGHQLQRIADTSGMQDVQIRVAGTPLLVAGIADSFAADLLRLSPVLVFGLLIALFIGFHGGRGRLRLLAVAGGGVLFTAAASRLLGLGLTPATVAAFPVVLGIAVDFGVQLQARYQFERASGAAPPDAARQARRVLAPTLGLAAAAMSLGFITLTASSIPLIDRLGVTLAVGTALSLLVLLAAGPPLMSWRDSGPGAGPPLLRTYSRRAALPGALAFAILGGLAVGGLAVSSGTRVQSDLAALAPKSLPELKQLEAIERELHTGGVLRVAITGSDVLRPDVLAWQRAAITRVLATDKRLRPGPSVADLIDRSGSTPAAADVNRIVGLLPPYLLNAVVSPQRDRTEISFSVPPASVAQQGRMLQAIRRALGTPPTGYSVTPVGLLARGAQSVDDLEHARPGLLLAALAAVLGLLAIVRRSWARSVIPLVPTIVTAGVSALVLRVSGVQLSPLGAGLEPLVLAVGVEFGLLLDARYHEARASGADPMAARDEAVRNVGGAVAVSAVAVAVGFGALTVSHLALLRQFGLLVAIEVVVCAATAIWTVPSLLAAVDLGCTADARSPNDAPAHLGALT